MSSLRGQRARRAVLADLAAGAFAFVLLGPEQLSDDQARAAVTARPIDRLVVDEAHCIDL